MDKDKEILIEMNKKLEASLMASQYLFILHAKQVGLKQEEVRKLLKMDSNKLSALWKLMKF